MPDLKFQIKGAVSDVTEHVGRKIKETFSRARELRLISAFFYYGYLSLLEPA